MRNLSRLGRLMATSLVALVISVAAATAADLAADAPRPNVLILLCDDLGYGDLGCFGHPAIRTPNLDRLAQQGLKLTACYAAAPVCSPSRVGLLTGRTPSRVGVYDWIRDGHVMHMGRNEITVAQRLRDAGYNTCHVGKWHCNGKFNSPEQPQPGDHGFEHWFSTQNNAAPTHHNPTNFVRNGQPVGPLEGYSCQLVADEAIRWLHEGRDAGKPFFVHCCFHEPHEQIASPPELVAQYPDAKKKGEALYYANVTNMDRAVGRLLQTLDEMKLAENTLVFFTSDNGPETLNRYPNAWRSHGSPGPYRGQKLWLYEGGLRVPGIIRWPARVKAGQVSDEPVCGLDVLPTLCALAGIAPPQDRVLDGTSIVPVLDGRSVERRVPLFWHYFRSIGEPKAAMRVGDRVILGRWDGPSLGPGASVHRGDMEIIKSAQLTGFELYDLTDDPAQQHDLASEQPQTCDELARRLTAKYKEVQSAGPVWDVPPDAPKAKRPKRANVPKKK